MLIFNFEDEETNSILANDINTIFCESCPSEKIGIQYKGSTSTNSLLELLLKDSHIVHGFSDQESCTHKHYTPDWLEYSH